MKNLESLEETVILAAIGVAGRCEGQGMKIEVVGRTINYRCNCNIDRSGKPDIDCIKPIYLG
jgi:hypothetical protein